MPCHRRLYLIFLFSVALLAWFPSPAQVGVQRNREIALLSDTQEPLWTEHLSHRKNRNTEATRLIFDDIVQRHFQSLFIAGDVVSLGYKEKKWKRMDQYLRNCRDAGIPVYALLGNHDVMLRPNKGTLAFNRRFPESVRTGYVQVVDSVAIVSLNSNFKHLSDDEIQLQQNFYAQTLLELDTAPGIIAIVVSCHHSPYSNSKTVGSSKSVQEKFVPLFLQSKKCRLFVSGHAHVFQHFRYGGKDFLVIGGGGGIRQPLKITKDGPRDLAPDYKPMFHYVILKRTGHDLDLTSRFLLPDFSGFRDGWGIRVNYGDW